jgi:UPF0042 nucleotide-binding protein
MPPEILIVTGLSGAGKSTVLKTLEDLGWEVVDNLPLSLLERVLAAHPGDADGDVPPLALGIGTRTRDFDPAAVMRIVDRVRTHGRHRIETLYLDSGTDEVARRYDETRRRHPLAIDRPARDGIERERELLDPMRRWANRLIDTTQLTRATLTQQIRAAFSRSGALEPTLSIMSFGFARGLPPDADLVFDMRFLRNPHWVPELKPGTGLDAPVADYIAGDPAYGIVRSIESLLLELLPRYRHEGKAYVNVAIGCTGGRHRSVHVADRIGRRLQDAGFSPTVSHRDLGTTPQDSLEDAPRQQ